MTKSRNAVCDVWVRCDRWPDAKDLARWAGDIFRIEGARAPHERAVALWKWTLITMGRGGPACHEGERGREGYLMDTLKYLNVHGGHYCDGLSRLMVNAWQSARCGRARKVVIFRLGHTIAELHYRDADGKTRWHAFDPQHGWYVYSRDGTHIASLAEIDADPDLLLDPADPPRPYFYSRSRIERWQARFDAARDTGHGDSPPPTHRMRLDLRRGERWKRLWGPAEKGSGKRGLTPFPRSQYWPYRLGPKPRPIGYVWVEEDIRGGGIADGFLGEYVEPYLYKRPPNAWLLHKGSGTRRCRLPGTVDLRYAVPLKAGAFRDGALRARGLSSARRASRTSAILHASRLGEVGVLVYEVQTPYIITDAAIDAVVRTGSDALDMLGIHVSTDGGSSWHQVWGNRFAQKGRPSARPRHIRAAFGAKAYHADQFSVVGKYGYQVRVDVLAQRGLGEVGLDEFVITTVGQCNMQALPALLPGRNRIEVTAETAPPGARLRVEYRWHEKRRGDRRVTRLLPATGGAFTIRVGGKEPRDVRMREVAVEVI